MGVFLLKRNVLMRVLFCKRGVLMGVFFLKRDVLMRVFLEEDVHESVHFIEGCPCGGVPFEKGMSL